MSIPDFVVIGAMRSGTTTLYNILNNVDGICMSKIKETNYFIKDNYEKHSYNWYSNLFSNKNSICGDISPNYSKYDVFKGVPKRIYETAPNAKIIYIVRERVERVISHYSHSFYHGHNLPNPDQLLTDPEGIHMLSSSLYAYQLKPYLKYFDMKQILIIQFDDLVNNTSKTIEKICLFIGNDKLKINMNKVSNTASNTSESLASLPSWFHKLNESKLLSPISYLLSTKSRQKIKYLLTTVDKKAKNSPPTFDNDTINSIHDYLNNDINEFNIISDDIQTAHNTIK